MPTLRLALAQLNATVGDLDGNRRLVERAISQARAQQADIVVVPELAITGYPPEDLLLKPSFIAANKRTLGELARSVEGVVALVGFVDNNRQGRLFNAAAVLAHGKQVGVYHKQHLPNYGVFDEKRYFSPGKHPAILDMGGVRIGLTLCEDLWVEEPARLLAKEGAELVVNLSASPYHAGKLASRQRLFSQRARKNRVAVAYCNLVGGQDELVFDGASLVLDAQGRRVAYGRQFSEDLVFVDLKLSPKTGAKKPPFRLIKLPHVWLPHKSLPRVERRILGDLQEIYEALTLGLRDYVRKNGFSTVVLGLSGGIDSALTACLAVDALGATSVKAAIMPSRFSSQQTQADAKTIAGRLGIESHSISIEPVLASYLKLLSPLFGNRPADTTEQNIQARIRGNLLMALSNKFGWLVLNTGNKSEMATGYTTLYGDMAGGLAVIKDVPKTLVYRLAHFRNQQARGKPIPETVFQRPPSAELAFNQTDQDTLPPYAVLDRIIKASVEEDRSFVDVVRLARVPKSVVKQVLRRVDHAEYKRRQGPPGIKITPRAFGRDRRMPITHQYEER